MLQGNLSYMSTNLFEMQSGINQTAQLIYGIPAAFVGAWQQVPAADQADPNTANLDANATVYAMTNNFGGNSQSIGYYTAFDGYWMASFQDPTVPQDASVLDREAYAVNQSVTAMASSGQLDSQTSQMMCTVAAGLTATNWNDANAIANLTISTMTSSIPSSLTSSMGVSASSLVNQLYTFGFSPSNQTLDNYAITLLETSYSNMNWCRRRFHSF